MSGFKRRLTARMDGMAFAVHEHDVGLSSLEGLLELVFAFIHMYEKWIPSSQKHTGTSTWREILISAATMYCKPKVK